MRINILILFTINFTMITNIYAHNIKIFAGKKDNNISGYIYSPGGIRIKNSTLYVYKNNKFISEIKTNNQGEFIYKNIDNSHYKFIYNQDGHLAEYNINKILLNPQKKENISQINDNQIFEIKEQLNKIENSIRIRDLIGGIGYIIGIAGLISFYKQRNHNKC